jgi:hypothetical protein
MTRIIDLTRLTGALLLFVVTCPIAVTAQTVSKDEPASTFAELQGRLKPGDGIYVVGTDGQRSRGFVEGVSDSSVTLLVNGQSRTFRDVEVGAVRRVHDSLRNGALVGALVGGGSLGLLTSSWGPEIAGPWALVGAGIGLGAGLAIDAALWRGPVLYRRGPGSVQFVPEIGKARKALRLSYRF